MNEFFTFRRMITPVFIQIIFWLGIGACVIGGMVLMVSGVGAYRGGGQALAGVLLILLGPLGVRIYCEVLIVLFRILDVLSEIAEKLSPGQGAGRGEGDRDQVSKA